MFIQNLSNYTAIDLAFHCASFCRRLTEKIFYSSIDTFEKHESLNDASFSHIFNFKSHLTLFKLVRFFKTELKSFK